MTTRPHALDLHVGKVGPHGFNRWGGGMAVLLVAALLSVFSGCATAPRPQSTMRVDVKALEREGDAELDRGCYLCLRSAAQKYDAAIAAGAESVRSKLVRTWILISVRERELGLRPTDALDRARAGYQKASPESLEPYLKVAAGLPLRTEGVSKEAMTEASRAALPHPGQMSRDAQAAFFKALRERGVSDVDVMAAYRARSQEAEEAFLAGLRERAARDQDVAAEYLLRSWECAKGPPAPSGPMIESPTPSAAASESSSNLFSFLAATCSRIGPDAARDTKTLEGLLVAEPRFLEAHYFLGRRHLAAKRLVSAEREFLAAANAFPGMAAAWGQLGGTRLLLEDYDWAARDLARALDIEPRQREALLAHAQALNYAGRYEEAMIPASRLIEFGAWYLSDASFWLAFSEYQLGRLQDADKHVREAKRTNPMNGDTARLAGLIAHRLDELDRAEQEFDLALSRNANDCESLLHLGMIHSTRAAFEKSVAFFGRARNCFSSAAAAAAAKLPEIDASSFTESRKEAARARVALRIKAAKRAQAGASLGAAEGETQRGAYDAALAYLAEAAVEAELSTRVDELRTRVASLRAQR
jgi:tetratricopeptide (TPR) repeat protein